MDNNEITFSVRDYRHIKSADIKVGSGITLLADSSGKDNTLFSDLISYSLLNIPSMAEVMHGIADLFLAMAQMNLEDMKRHEEKRTAKYVYREIASYLKGITPEHLTIVSDGEVVLRHDIERVENVVGIHTVVWWTPASVMNFLDDMFQPQVSKFDLIKEMMGDDYVCEYENDEEDEESIAYKRQREAEKAPIYAFVKECIDGEVITETLPSGRVQYIYKGANGERYQLKDAPMHVLLLGAISLLIEKDKLHHCTLLLFQNPEEILSKERLMQLADLLTMIYKVDKVNSLVATDSTQLEKRLKLGLGETHKDRLRVYDSAESEVRDQYVYYMVTK